MQRTGSLRIPEAPKACIRCGTPYGLTRQPLLVQLGGAVPAKVRFVDLPFCPRCWRRHESTRLVVRVAALLAVLAMGLGAAFAVASWSWTPLLAAAVVGLGSLLAALVVRRRALPVVVSTSADEVVFAVPNAGDVRVRVEP